jgi:iron complex outermembrane receptor protein
LNYKYILLLTISLFLIRVRTYSRNLENQTEFQQSDTASYTSPDILVTSDITHSPILRSQSISKISQENLFKYSPSSVSAAFANQPGVSMISFGEGITRPIIRGLGGTRVKTLVDGLGFVTQAWDELHGLGINDNDFTQATAVLGTSTMLYGTDAIGGALLFEDHIPMNMTETNINTNAGFISNGLGFFGRIEGLGNTGKNSFWKLSFDTKSISDYRFADNERAFNTRFWRTGFNAIYGFKEDWGSIKFRYKLNFALYGILDPNESENNPAFEEEEEYPHEFEAPYHSIVGNRLQINSDIKIGDRFLELAAAGELDLRNEFEPLNGNPKVPTKYIGLETKGFHFRSAYPIIQSADFETKLGIRTEYSDMKNKAVYTFVPDNTVLNTGAFLASNYKITSWELNGGISWDRAAYSTNNYINLFDADIDKNFAAFSGNLGASYLTSNTSKVSLNLATGFRPPNINELASTGFKPESMRVEYGNSNLEAERSSSVEFSFNETSRDFRYFGSVFYQDFNNFIYLEEMLSPPRPETRPTFNFVQNDAEFYGFELGAGFTSNWETSSSDFNLSFSTTKNNLISNSYIIYNLPVDKLNLELKHNFADMGSFKKPQIAAQFLQFMNIWNDGRLITNSGGKWYNLLNLNLQTDVSLYDRDLTIGLNGKNLLNRQYIDPMSNLSIFGVPNPGISVNAYFRYSI